MLKRAWDDKIIFGWVVFVLLPLVVLEVIFGTKMSGSIEKQAAEQATQVVTTLADMVQVSLGEEIQRVSLLAVDDGAGGRASLKQRMEWVNARFDHVMAYAGDRYETIFLTDTTGVMIVARPDAASRGTNVGETDYFKAAIGGKTSIGKPYRSDKTDHLVSVVCAPLYAKKEKFLGVVGAVLKLEPLLNRISSVRIGPSGYSFVVDKDGLVLAHSDKGHALGLRVNQMAGMEEVSQRMLAQQKGAETFAAEGAKKLAVFAPIALTGWSLCVVQETDDMIVLPRSTRNMIFLTGGVFLIVAVLAALYFPRKRKKPAEREREPVVEPVPVEWPIAPDPEPTHQPQPPLTQRAEEGATSGEKAEVAIESSSERTYAAHVAARGSGDFDRVSTFIKRPLDKQTHYEVLELAPHATPFEIRQAYKTAIQLYQASSMASYSFFSEEERNRILARLEEAYLILIHEESRAEYDQMLIERGDMEESQQYRKMYKKPVPIIEMKDHRTQSSSQSDLSEKVRSKKAIRPIIDRILVREVLTGADLRQIRTELEVSLREIADITRVRIGLLHAIEEDQTDQISSRLHLESFVKSYANCLGLDADQIVKRYMKRLKE